MSEEERGDRPAGGESSDRGVSRRELGGIVGAGIVLSQTVACGEGDAEPAKAGESAGEAELLTPLHRSSTRALARGIRQGDVSSEEVVGACLDRVAEVNPALNAVVQLDAEGAMERARGADRALAAGESWGPLHGVPMTIKDSLDTAGMISSGGTQGRASFVPERDATVVARLLGAGAILMGKTNTPELTLSFETDNLVYGRTNNPWDTARSSGGSSGGAAAIVAAGGSPFDIGSDYGGSIRLPAHWNGIAGIKPTAGRVPRTGHVYPFGGLQDDFQQIGPLARSVDDLILLLPLIMGPDWIDPSIVELPWSDPGEVDLAGLRVAFHSDNGIGAPTPETVATVEAVAAALDAEVLAVVEAPPPGGERGVRRRPAALLLGRRRGGLSTPGGCRHHGAVVGRRRRRSPGAGERRSSTRPSRASTTGAAACRRSSPSTTSSSVRSTRVRRCRTVSLPTRTRSRLSATPSPTTSPAGPVPSSAPGPRPRGCLWGCRSSPDRAAKTWLWRWPSSSRARGAATEPRRSEPRRPASGRAARERAVYRRTSAVCSSVMRTCMFERTCSIDSSPEMPSIRWVMQAAARAVRPTPAWQ